MGRGGRLAALFGLGLAVATVVVAFMVAMRRYTSRPEDWIPLGLGGIAYTTLALYLMWPIPLRRSHGLQRLPLIVLAEAPLLVYVGLVWRGVLLPLRSPWPFVVVAVIVGAALGLLERRLTAARRLRHDAERRHSRPAGE